MWKNAICLVAFLILVQINQDQNRAIEELRIAIEAYGETICAQNEVVNTLAKVSVDLTMERLERIESQEKASSTLAGQ